jgi:hypothetical protein
MHANHLIFPFMLASGLAWSQSPTPTPTATPSSAVASDLRAGRAERSVHILVEDSAARIDEIRMGGDTQSISVQPKGSMPAYQVAPKTGERTWKVLGF